ncbi:hypothetical protein SAMN05216266_102299 [Amycolatopsis marina]|uniref:Uncharacterized protein n=1 Tax=Amycolatopsis marina TaxID=490629 RepID=A0A1I0WXG7_9PSEU|nr:hypothetical protein [Amycolatopsis marina]SFA93429.1 hypothetical protein SAMN05216266_102299 [Amycolatopsis marina]
MPLLSNRRPRAIVGLVLGLVLAGGGVVAAPASAYPATQGDRTPGDEPLPGYTVHNPPLPPAEVGGEPATVLQGIHEHAAYTMEVPPDWNGELAMWAHGYRGNSTVLTVDPPAHGLRQRLLDQGFAWAASSYYANGYDVRAGVTSTRDLAQHFRDLVGKPKRVFVAGMSMGGHVIGRSLEQYPGFYDGALPMCGVLGDHELFDYLLDYQLVAQDLADVPAYPVPEDYLETAVPLIQEKLGMTELAPGGPDTLNELGAQFRAITVERTGGPRPGDAASFAFWKDFLFGLSVPSGLEGLAANPGDVATNIGTRYEPNTPVNVNASVQRVFPENVRARYSPLLTEVPRIAGRPTAPVLSLHGLGDLFVPFSMEQAYREDASKHHRTRLLVQRAIRTVNHCEFSPSEVGTAWDDLVRWTDTGERPDGDVVHKRSAVSQPDYGCEFSDAAAYDNPVPGSTRRLFAACPA